MAQEPHPIGWREWLALPDLGIGAIKAKIDTGARTSSLHVDSLEVSERHGVTWLSFTVSTTGRRASAPVACAAPAVAHRRVSDSSGHTAMRWFIRSTVELAGRRFVTDINLTDRRHMLFPMLLGRVALERRFVVDPAASFVHGRPARRRVPRSKP